MAAKGVPSCGMHAAPRLLGATTDASRSRGTSVTTFAIRFVFVTSRRRSGSKATLPQLMPPATPGNWTEPSRLGGVKIPSERLAAILSRHLPRSHGVSPQASSGESPGGCSGGGSVGKGCVGESLSPGPPACGTGRSSTGKSGAPVSRSSRKDVPHLRRLGDRRQRATLACAPRSASAATRRRSPRDRGARSGSATRPLPSSPAARPPSSRSDRARCAGRRRNPGSRCPSAGTGDRAPDRPRRSTRRSAFRGASAACRRRRAAAAASRAAPDRRPSAARRCARRSRAPRRSARRCAVRRPPARRRPPRRRSVSAGR